MEIAAWLAAVEREPGNSAAARSELEAVSDPCDASQAARYWLDSHAEQLLAEERFDEALAVARDAVERFAATHAIDSPARAHEALALHHLGDREQALALVPEEVETGTALRILGTVGQIDGIVHPREAAALAARSPARLELAKALAAHGAVLRADRRPAEARDPLRRALELADALGADARDTGAPGALRRRRPPTHDGPPRPRRADTVRAARRRTRRGRPDQPRDRRSVVRDTEDRRAAPPQRLPQARRTHAPRPRPVVPDRTLDHPNPPESWTRDVRQPRHARRQLRKSWGTRLGYTPMPRVPRPAMVRA